ncbi:MAG: DMT family transporter [Acidobacteriota bacterium]
MRPADFLRLLLLSAIWGASFLFMRIAAPSFGPIPLILCCLGSAALFFAPLLLRRDVRRQLVRYRWPLAVVGVFNSAVPFSLLAFSTLSLEAGFTALLNATTPLFAAAVGAIWLRIALARGQILGLVLGFAGVAILSWGNLDFREGGTGWAIVASLAAGLSYGISAHIAKRGLADVSSVVVATGTMIAATVATLPLGLWLWPATPPDPTSWASAIALGIACTALAYLLYFDLIAKAGATNASTVTFVVPVFAIVWGNLLLDEQLTLQIVLGMAVTLLGTAFAIGLVGKRPVGSRPVTNRPVVGKTTDDGEDRS